MDSRRQVTRLVELWPLSHRTYAGNTGRPQRLPRRPFRGMFQLEEHLTGFRHQQHPFIFAIRVVLDANALRVTVAEVNLLADFGRNGGRQSDLGATFLDAVLVSSDAANVSGMRQHTPWIMLKLIPLLQEIVPAMVANFLNHTPVSHANLPDMGRI